MHYNMPSYAIIYYFSYFRMNWLAVRFICISWINTWIQGIREYKLVFINKKYIVNKLSLLQFSISISLPKSIVLIPFVLVPLTIDLHRYILNWLIHEMHLIGYHVRIDRIMGIYLFYAFRNLWNLRIFLESLIFHLNSWVI